MRTLVYLLILTAVVSCRNKSPDHPVEQLVISEELTDMNRMFVGDESKRINEFAEKHSYKMERTGTGLRYEIYEKKNGIRPAQNSQVEIRYNIFLLDGTLCYSSDTASLKIQLGAGQQIHGLEEGILLMSEGEKARFVIPAHLAYGMQGDQNKIPPSNALFIDVELIKVVK